MTCCISEYRGIKNSPTFFMEGEVGEEMIRINKISGVSISELCLSYLNQFDDGMIQTGGLE